MLTALVIAAVGCGVAVVVNTLVDRNQEPLRSIADMPDAVIGRVVGVVRAVGSDVLEAPLTARPCLFYTVHATDLERPLADERRGLVFELDDGTGIARIDATVATSRLLPAKFHNTPLTAPTQRQVALLERHGYQGTFLNVSYQEAVVQVGDRIAVTGAGRRIAGVFVFDRKPVLANDRRATRVRLPRARVRHH